MPRSKEAPAEREAETEQSVTVGDNTPTTLENLYERLTTPFSQTFERKIPGGRTLTYVTGEQVIARLNEVVGPLGWDWEVLDSGITQGETYVKGAMTVRVTDAEGRLHIARKMGFGGVEIKLKRDGSGALSIANDMKAADTDAFKKAAAKFGVAKELYERTAEDELPFSAPGASAPSASYTPRTAGAYPAPQFPSPSGTSITGVIAQKSPNGVRIENTWYNVSKFRPIDLSAYNAGQLVTIEHPEGKTFIDNIARADNIPSSAPQGSEDGALESLPF